MSLHTVQRSARNPWLLLALLTLASMTLFAQDPTVTFVNQGDAPIFLKVHLTDEPALCTEGDYVTYEIAAGEELIVDFEESSSACYCALSVPRDTCEFPEITQPGETVTLQEEAEAEEGSST